MQGLQAAGPQYTAQYTQTEYSNANPNPNPQYNVEYTQTQYSKTNPNPNVKFRVYILFTGLCFRSCKTSLDLPTFYKLKL